jgi:uncharacterized protein
MNQSQNFLNASHQGKNQWWRYLIGILLILFFYIGLGSVALCVIFLKNTQLSGADISNPALFNEKLMTFLRIPSIPVYVAFNMPSLLGAIGLFITIVFVHQRKLASMVRADRMIRWNRIFAGFSIWLIISCVFFGVGYILNPQNYVFSFTQDWLFCLLLALILIPIQASFEELLYRSYFLQGMGLIIHNRVVIVVVNGIIFTIPHLNGSELAHGGTLAIYYFMFGSFFAALAIRDNGLELPLGIHAANNLMMLVVSCKDSAIQLPSVWQSQNSESPMTSIITSLVGFALAYYVFFVRLQRPI